MDRGLSRHAVVLIGVIAGHGAFAASNESWSTRILERFLESANTTPHQYRALRHLEAHTQKLDKSAWMEVWTEADASGFRYEITAEDGSGAIRNKVFRETLDAERRMWEQGNAHQSAISRDNYVFVDCAADTDDLTCVSLKPRRKEVTLVDGAIFLDPADGELVRIEGSLSKSPSFWTRKVDVRRQYQRIGGVRVPVSVESNANVRIAGPSTFSIHYEYESVNGNRVGTPVASRAPHVPLVANR
jgi:hypothetical protein